MNRLSETLDTLSRYLRAINENMELDNIQSRINCSRRLWPYTELRRIEAQIRAIQWCTEFERTHIRERTTIPELVQPTNDREYFVVGYSRGLFRFRYPIYLKKKFYVA